MGVKTLILSLPISFLLTIGRKLITLVALLTLILSLLIWFLQLGVGTTVAVEPSDHVLIPPKV